MTMFAVILSVFAIPFLLVDKIFGSGKAFNAVRTEYWKESVSDVYKSIYLYVIVLCEDRYNKDEVES